MPLRDFILHNFWLKLFSLLLATLIWLTVKNDQHDKNRLVSETERGNVIRKFVRPVVIKGGPAGLRQTQPAEVRVTVSVDTALLERSKDLPIEAFVEAADANDMQGLLPVQVKAPPGVTPVSVFPTFVRLKLPAAPGAALNLPPP